MRFQVLSDLHLERHPERLGLLAVLPVRADVLVLAGDLSGGPGAERQSAHFARLFADAAARWPHTVVVLGNHDHHGDRGDQAYLRAHAAAAGHANVHVLDNAVVVIAGVRVLGCTMWGRFEDLDPAATVERTPFTAAAIRGLADASHKFLASHWRPGDVVVTHYLPCSTQTLRDVYGHRIRFPYAPETSSRIAATTPAGGDHRDKLERSALWISGHTHDAFDVRCGDGRWVCNPLGLVGESTGADPEGLVVSTP